jgi:hypothetical protein
LRLSSKPAQLRVPHRRSVTMACCFRRPLGLLSPHARRYPTTSRKGSCAPAGLRSGEISSTGSSSSSVRFKIDNRDVRYRELSAGHTDVDRKRTATSHIHVCCGMINSFFGGLLGRSLSRCLLVIPGRAHLAAQRVHFDVAESCQGVGACSCAESGRRH